ncbi:hypothetical protein R1flu_014943 [Riccia fluitans]|uniref:Uncharacterized protein n=1 Tax=Riccia fluitans TaxID=41844 RepID=A0ABD1YHN6_9MARC
MVVKSEFVMELNRAALYTSSAFHHELQKCMQRWQLQINLQSKFINVKSKSAALCTSSAFHHELQKCVQRRQLQIDLQSRFIDVNRNPSMWS